jgi:glutamate synthase (NADPH/NADH) small chain
MASGTAEDRKVDRKARMALPFEDVPARPAEERIHDFEPTFLFLTPEQARKAAERCIHCPDPAPCQEACPAHNNISEALWLVEQGDFIEAAKLYRKSSSMPEICGLVCPHQELCQGACVRNKRGEPVLTGAIEAFCAAYQREHSEVKIPVGKPTGKKVAIVGAGPSGLACAEQLVQKGHDVTIFDANPAPGGLLVYGIPNFKLPKHLVKALVDDLKDAGVHFVQNTRVGKDPSIDDLMEEGYDAVYVAVGAGIDSTMEAPGIDLPGIYQATDFLVRGNVDPQLLPADQREKPVVGRKVVVIGGGDTASDCLRTALRLGASEVTCLYRRTEAEMPGNKKDRELAKEEGAKFRFLTQPIRFIEGPHGTVSAVECLQCELGEPDDSGRRRPIPIEGSNFTVQADTVILALGYWPDPTIGEATPGLETKKWGLIVADPETGATSRANVYAGGDAVTGPHIVGTAMVAGRKAAAAIDEQLSR